jgi:hypothetical protein
MTLGHLVFVAARAAYLLSGGPGVKTRRCSVSARASEQAGMTRAVGIIAAVRMILLFAR